MLLKLIHLDYRKGVFRNYSFDFLHEGRNEKPYTYKIVFDWNLIQLVLCIRVRTVSKVEKCFLNDLNDSF